MEKEHYNKLHGVCVFIFGLTDYIDSIPQNHTCCYKGKNVKNESLLKGCCCLLIFNVIMEVNYTIA